jgi:hypothetical protein
MSFFSDLFKTSPRMQTGPDYLILSSKICTLCKEFLTWKAKELKENPDSDLRRRVPPKFANEYYQIYQEVIHEEKLKKRAQSDFKELKSFFSRM